MNKEKDYDRRLSDISYHLKRIADALEKLEDIYREEGTLWNPETEQYE